MTGYAATSFAGDTGVSSACGAVEANRSSIHLLNTTVDFGKSSNDARTTITGVPWVKIYHRPLAFVTGRPPDVNTGLLSVNDMDALRDEIRVIVTNIVDGVSFDVKAYSATGSSGVFLVQIIGVGT